MRFLISNPNEKFSEFEKLVLKIYSSSFNKITKKINFDINFSFEEIKINLEQSPSSMKKIAKSNDVEILFYFDNSLNEIFLINPKTLKLLYNLTYEKKIISIIENSIFNFIFYHKFLKEKNSLFLKNFSKSLSEILSNDFDLTSIKYDIENYDSEKYIKEKKVILMSLYTIFIKKGEEFLYKWLEKFFLDNDFEKSLMEIFRRDSKVLINDYKNEITKKNKDQRLRFNR